MLALAHGLMGVAGLGVLLYALRGQPQGDGHGDAMGVGSFGLLAAILFGVAAAIGVCLPLLRRRSPRAMGAALAVHATLAIGGFVLFLAWTSLGD